MTEIDAFLHGRFPRSEEQVQATRDLDRDRTTPEQVEAVRSKDRQALLEMQDRIGLDLVTDGMFTWQDAFRPFTDAVQGLETGELTRYFETNTFYRRVHLKARMHYVGLDDRHLPATDGRPAVGVLPGPHWCTYDFDDEIWGNPINEIEAITHEVLLQAAADLVDAGAELILLEEPIVPKEGEGVDLAQRAWGEFGDLDTRVVTWFPYYDAAWTLGELDPEATTYGVDLFATDLSDLAGHAFPNGLVVGAVDAQSWRLETVDEIVDHVGELLDAVETPYLGLTPTTHLEFLPWDRAEAKAEVLAEAAAELEEVA